jgi:hypothetical protein
MIEHKDLAQSRWAKMSLLEKMANIGSEVERAINWREKNNHEYSLKSASRALELFDLTLDSPMPRSSIREVARAREIATDFFFDKNEYSTTSIFLKKYFLAFAIAARKNR